MNSNLVIRSRAYSAELADSARALEEIVWSELGFLNHTRAHQSYYDEILERYADCQLCLVDERTGNPLALANCVPASYQGADEDLPPEGWDWLVEVGAARTSARPNIIGALAISVSEEHRNKGLATRMIRALRELAEARGYDRVVAPVRPSAKCNHPYTSIDDYIAWSDEQGRVFDPWLRAHLSQGGQMVRACERSMIVEEHLAFWETWAGRRFECSGSYVLKGALVPIWIDVAQELGRYEEPNVWVTYAA